MPRPALSAWRLFGFDRSGPPPPQTEGGEPWDRSAWRTLEIVALVVLENMMPTAITG